MSNVGGELLARLDPPVERCRHGPERRGHLPDLVAPVGVVGQLCPRRDRAADVVGGRRQLAHRFSDGPSQQPGRRQRGQQRERGQRPNHLPLFAQDPADLAGRRGQEQYALYRPAVAATADRFGDGDDLFEFVIEQQNGGRLAFERFANLRIGATVCGPDLAVNRKVVINQPRAEAGPEIPSLRPVVGIDLRSSRTGVAASSGQRRSVDDEIAGAVIYARPYARPLVGLGGPLVGRGRRDHAIKDLRHPFGLQRQLKRGEIVVPIGNPWRFRQIDPGNVGHVFRPGIFPDRGGDDLPLLLQRLALGIEQPPV